MWGTQSFASATARMRPHILPPSEMKSLYGSTTRRAVVSLSYAGPVMTFSPPSIHATMRMPGFRATPRRVEGSTVTQLAQHSGQVHFPVAGLEAALERGLKAALGLGLTGPLAEEVGIAPKVLGRRERDRIDAVLDRNMAGGRKLGDSMRERSHEIAERAGR